MSTVSSDIYEALNELGVPQHILGYNYLSHAVSMIINNESYQKLLITKHIYPEVAEAFDTTPTAVERSIRHAISRSFDVCKYDVLYKYFGNSIDPDSGAVVPSHYLYTVATTVKRSRNMSD